MEELMSRWKRRSRCSRRWCPASVLFITGAKCPLRTWTCRHERAPAAAPAAEGFMEPLWGLVETLIPQRSLETQGRLQEWAPCRQFHRRGPEKQPAACQLDKENKMDCTEM